MQCRYVANIEFANYPVFMANRRIFAGAVLRSLRSGRALRQQQLAELLGISAPYLSQLENDDRALTPHLIDRLRKLFPVEWQDIPADRGAKLLEAFDAALGSSSLPNTYSTAQIHRLVDQFPEFAESFVALSQRHRADLERLEMLDEALGSGGSTGGRLPWDQVRDWFHNTNNYIDDLDRKSEDFSLTLSEGNDTPSTTQLIDWLAHSGIKVKYTQDGPVRRFDYDTQILFINAVKSQEGSRFQIFWHIADTLFKNDINNIVRSANFNSKTAQQLLSIGLANYMAGAMLMPYERFRTAARIVRHDIDRLRHTFGSTFEQVCHRLSNLQRPNSRGIPMYFCRVDMAGNITKRHSATRLRFARFGGACPLWVVHEAAAVPDRIHIQLAEMPDGVRYVSIAKGLVKQTGSYTETPRRYAVALGCEADFASEFIYADALNLHNRGASTPIGVSCRICSRVDCDQRAYPPSDKEIMIEPSLREIVPYRIKPD